MQGACRRRLWVVAQCAGWLSALGGPGCAPAPAPRPVSAASPASDGSHKLQVKAELEAMLGVSYDIFTDELQSTYGPANQEMTEATALFFKEGGRAFDAEQALRARELFESAAHRVADLKMRRAKAWSALPILFIQLEHVAAKADNGLVMIAFSRGELDEMSRQLAGLLDRTDHAFDTIAHELQIGLLPKNHSRYRQLQDEFADMSAKAHSLLGMESKRRGDVAKARVHWQKGLDRARDEEMRTLLRRLLDGR